MRRKKVIALLISLTLLVGIAIPSALTQVLRQLHESICAAMEQRSGLDTAMQSAAQMVASRSGAELLQAACDLQTAIDSLDANASAGAVIGWLAMKLR